jgi:hypothetical protein
MLRRSPRREERAGRIAEALSDHQTLLTHARPLDRTQLRALGLKIDYLEADQELQDRVLTVYHATMHTFSAMPAVKIVENQDGRAFIKISQEILVQAPPPSAAPGAPSPPSR